jgi:hypothetical protein
MILGSILANSSVRSAKNAEMIVVNFHNPIFRAIKKPRKN